MFATPTLVALLAHVLLAMGAPAFVVAGPGQTYAQGHAANGQCVAMAWGTACPGGALFGPLPR